MICRKCGKKFEEILDKNVEFSIQQNGKYMTVSEYAVCPVCGERNWVRTNETDCESETITVL